MSLIRVYIQHVDTRSFVLYSYNLEVRSEYSYVVERKGHAPTVIHTHTLQFGAAAQSLSIISSNAA